MTLMFKAGPFEPSALGTASRAGLSSHLAHLVHCCTPPVILAACPVAAAPVILATWHLIRVAGDSVPAALHGAQVVEVLSFARGHCGPTEYASVLNCCQAGAGWVQGLQMASGRHWVPAFISQ